MERIDALALERLSALAQESRLAVFRHLVQAGPAGRGAGDIATALGIPPNTLSSQLNILANADLVTRQRDGRAVIYAANFDAITNLLVYLMTDCCEGRDEICQPVLKAMKNIAC